MPQFAPQYRLDRSIGEEDHVRGTEDADVEVVLYGDYQCPYTARVVPIVEELLDEQGDNIRFAYRYFPLNDIHPHSQAAAEAAESAAEQGRFWEMHGTLFQNFRRLDTPSIAQYARELGLDADQIALDLENRTHAERIKEDYDSGKQSGVESTPTFYINGVRYDGENETGALRDAIRNAPAR